MLEISSKSTNSMKNVCRLAVGLVALGGFSVAHGQVLLYDDFTEASINTNLWVVSLPQAGSSVTESGGSLTTTARGVLGTVSQFQAPYVITGVVTMLSGIEHFNIVLRSNLSSPGASSSYTRTGVIVEFAMDGQGYSIYNYASAADTHTLVVGSYPFEVGKPYSYIITDNGTAITISINGGAPISATTSFSTGNQIGFYSRELAGCSSRLDAVSIALPGTAEPIQSATPTPTPPSDRLINVSTRGFIGAGAQVLIGGFVVSGTTTETVLIRGVGPALAQFGVTGSLSTPQVTLFDNAGNIIATNTGWGNASVKGPSTIQASIQQASTANFSEAGAFLLPTGSGDCAMVAVLPSGAYTVQVTGTGGTTGIALVEAYELP